MAKPTTAQLAAMREAEQAEIDAVRALALKSTWVLLTEVLYPDTWREHYCESLHKPILDQMDALEPGGRMGTFLPRTHRKTQGLMIPFAIRLILADYNVRVLIVSALDDTAKKLVGEGIRAHFVGNKSLHRYFPECQISPTLGTQYEFTHPLRSKLGLLDPTVRGTYLGAPFITRRADVILCDDAIDEKDVATPDLAAKTNAKVNQLIPLLDVNPRYSKWYLFGTFKSYNDYYSLAVNPTVADEGVDKPKQRWQTIVRAALEDTNGQPSLDGDPILPNVHTRASILQILEDCRIDPMKGESYFWREYMGRVQAPGDQKFHAEWFDRWVPKLPPDIVWSGIAFDSATKDEQVLFRGDEAVLGAAHFDTYGRLFITDCAFSTGWKSADVKRELLGMMQRNHITNIIKEKVGEGAMFGQMRAWCNEARLPVTFYPLQVRGLGKKVLRITELLQGPLQAGKIFFVGERGRNTLMDRFYRELVDEATHLGMWSKDNKIDMLSLFFHPDVRVLPPTGRRVEWKSPILRQPQISTAMTNPAALAYSHGDTPTQKASTRLSPFGETTILTDDQTFLVPSTGGVMPTDDDAWWEK